MGHTSPMVKNLRLENDQTNARKACKDSGCKFARTQVPNRSAVRAFAFAASTARSFGGALVSIEWRSRAETAAISSTAARKRASFAFEGLLIPLILRTYCNEDARTSSEVTGGSKLNSVLMFLHID